MVLSSVSVVNLADMIQDDASAVGRDDSVGLRCTLELRLKRPDPRFEDSKAEAHAQHY